MIFRILSKTIRRIFIWICIPFRIFTELFNCYVGAPNETGEERPLSSDAVQMKLWEKEGFDVDWWGVNSPLLSSGLKKLNPIRIKLIGEAYLKEMLGLNETWEDVIQSSMHPLEGAKICDVGCGGGLLSEALYNYGAKVTGLDVIPKVIDAAKRHWLEIRSEGERQDGPEYVCAPIEGYAADNAGLFDIVVCSEVLEHVRNPRALVGDCCKLVKPGGCVVFTTINRTIWSLLFFIIFCEDFLGFIPHGTHHLYMFVKPEEICRFVEPLGLKVLKTIGIVPGPRPSAALSLSSYSFSPCLNLDYGVIAKRPEY